MKLTHLGSASMQHPSIPNLHAVLHIVHAMPHVSEPVGNATGKVGIPLAYRRTNTIKNAIRMKGKRNIITGTQSDPKSILNFLKVLPK